MIPPKPPYHLPLWEFFQALRRHGYALGVDDYALLIEAMGEGFGLETESQLFTLCRTLWYKPGQSWEVFEDQFERTFRLFSSKLRKEADQPAPPLPPVLPTPPPVIPPLPPSPASEPLDTKKPKPKEKAVPLVSSPQEFIHLNITSSREKEGEALSQGSQLQSETDQMEFLWQGAYHAITSRQLANTWKYLPDRYLWEQNDTIDLAATIEAYSRKGRIEQIYFEKGKKGLSHLLLLTDQEGSMVAFHDLCEQVVASAPRPISKLPAHYYFHDVPGPTLYQDKQFVTATEIDQLKKYYFHQKAQILIISDAGAARGRYSAERVYETQDALETLRQIAPRIVWLNPVPRDRWQGTTAQYISELLVPMFELTELGLQKAVNILSGKQKGRRS